MAGLLNNAAYRGSLNPDCGYNKIFNYVIELPDRAAISAVEIDHIRSMVEDRLWGWHFVKYDVGPVVKPANHAATRRQKVPVPNHYLCVSFEDQTDLVQVRFSVFGC